MLNAIYNVIITPLSIIIEFFYSVIFEVTNNKGISVIALSFVVTLLTLPIYMVAETWSEKERAIQNKMKYWLSHIKKTFSGDERYMMQAEYYRQNNYHPLMALRSSLSILIQVPFFIAAYKFLSELEPLRGAKFLFINDLGAPDAMFKVGGFSVNVLPIAMTVINCVAGFIYTTDDSRKEGVQLREKLQIYLLAFIFLVLLYNSPSGLVVYWTMNNILSLVKNIFYKLKNPKKVLYIILCVFSAVCVVYSFTVLAHKNKIIKAFVLLLGILLPLLPFAIIKIAKWIDASFSNLDNNKKLRFSIFFISALVLAVLCGLAIPSIIMESEVENYCYVDGYNSPFFFLLSPIMHAIGFFVFWPFMFYVLFSDRVKKVLAVLFAALSVCAMLNCFVFGGSYGPLYPELRFMEEQYFFPTVPALLLNLFAMLAVVVLVFFILEKKAFIMHFVSLAIVISLLAVSIIKIAGMNTSYKKISPPNYSQKLEPVLHLSKTGKNVIVLIQDGCFSPFIPFVFDECKGLNEKFDGFKWYPNAISLGRLTMTGTSGILGGYDYTPFQINLDEEKTIQTKYNEALLSLPLLFTENGWLVQVADFPYENFYKYPTSDMYINNPSLSVNGIEVESYSDVGKKSYSVKYKGHKNIEHVELEKTYSDYFYAQYGIEKEPYLSYTISRNFIWFSFFKIVPPVLRRFVYHDDYWCAYNRYQDSSRFVNNYSVHKYLPALTDFYTETFNNEELNGTFMVIDNCATHDPAFLQAPEYEYSENVTNLGNSPLKNDMAFSSMCGVFKRFSEFIDYLKENDAYDNTRIIIVSDHGLYKSAGELLKSSENFPMEKGRSVVTLMEKDFDSHGNFICAEMTKENFENGVFGNDIDMTFMTNADVPYLATRNLIPNAANPFTKRLFNVENKNDYSIITTASAQSTRIRNNKKYDVDDSEWYKVTDNIFVDENWQRLYPEAVK